MANLRKPLAVIFSFIFLYTYVITENQHGYPLTQKEENHAGNPDSYISETCFVNTFLYHNEEKNFSSGKPGYNWFTKLNPDVSQASLFQNNDKSLTRLQSALLYSDEVTPNFTIRTKIFPFHYFL